jgi:outer membrane murein-binding lipoprotein Lpp
MKLTFVLLSVCFLAACNNNATKLDQQQSQLTSLQAAVASLSSNFDVFEKAFTEVHDKERNARINEIVYSVWDTDRKQRIAFLVSSRPISNGEVVHINDDVWRVQAVNIATEKTGENSRGNDAAAYKINTIEILVTFVGKEKAATAVP